MRMTKLLVIGGLLAAAVTGGAALAADWEQIFLDGPVDYALPDGTTRTLDPSCSGGPQVQPDGSLAPADTQYSFFIQRGLPRRVLFFMDGGGACWDGFTCIGSPLSGASTYSQTVDETADQLATAGGVFDTDNPDNPYRYYTKVFIPYCTADVHWGSRDSTYSVDLGERDPVTWTIRHRGLDNFLAALAWLQQDDAEQGVDLGSARRVTVAGASAGGYGVHFGFAYIAPLAPNARVSMIADAAIGVINSSFIRQALYNPDAPGTAAWGVEDNLPSWVPGFDLGLFAQGIAFPNDLVAGAFQVLSDYRSRARFATLTSNLDTVQISFYALMEGRLTDPTIIAEWYENMAAITAATASVPDYRFNIESGAYHTLLGSDLFFEQGANGVSAAEWIWSMLTPRGLGWENLDAGAPAGR